MELKDLKKKDNKVTAITSTFSMNEYEYEKIKNESRLSTTT